MKLPTYTTLANRGIEKSVKNEVEKVQLVQQQGFKKLPATTTTAATIRMSSQQQQQQQQRQGFKKQSVDNPYIPLLSTMLHLQYNPTTLLHG